MMRSLYSGVSGLKVHQTKMDVIANNISNVNTTAFKSGRVTFSDYFSQTISSAQSGNASRGGINPMQVGLGANIASIDINMTQGSNQRTDRKLDCMVSGEGFFIVGKGADTFFTRDGNFGFDNYGNLVNSAGLNVLGWGTTVDPNNPGKYLPAPGSVKPITLTSDQQTMPPATTKNLEAKGNINVVGDPNDPTAAIETPTTFSFIDSIGNKFTVDAKYVWINSTTDATTGVVTPVTPPKMELQIGDAAYLNGDRSKAYALTVTPDTTTAGNASLVIGSSIDAAGDAYVPAGKYTTMGSLYFTPDGVISTTASAADTAAIPPKPAIGASDAAGLFSLTISSKAPDIPADAKFGNAGKVALDLTSLTIFDNVKGNAIIEDLDGNIPGSLKDVSISPDGSVVGVYTNGEQRLLAFIPLANFDNPSGLQRAGGNLFQITSNSGDFNGIGATAESFGSKIASGQLEMSNVDIAQEFTDMIVTQRGFQANSKSITTSDEMLQELVNLKR